MRRQVVAERMKTGIRVIQMSTKQAGAASGVTPSRHNARTEYSAVPSTQVIRWCVVSVRTAEGHRAADEALEISGE
jgi:hypothetical protein